MSSGRHLCVSEDAVAAFRSSSEQGPVGGFHQIFGVAVGFGYGGPESRRVRKRRSRRDPERHSGNALADACGDTCALYAVGAGEGDAELVSAEPAGNVGRPQLPAHDVTDGFENFVAHRVAVAFVDLSE